MIVTGIGDHFVAGIDRIKIASTIAGILTTGGNFLVSSETKPRNLYIAIDGLKRGVTWNGRTSTANHIQPDGSTVVAGVNEIRIAGATRVNLADGTDYGFNALGVNYNPVATPSVAYHALLEAGDGAIVIPEVESTDPAELYIRWVDQFNVMRTEPVFDGTYNALTTYNAGTKQLIVGGDTSVTRRIVSVTRTPPSARGAVLFNDDQGGTLMPDGGLVLLG